MSADSAAHSETMSAPATAKPVEKMPSYGILENPMWIEWTKEMQMFFVHENGEPHETQPWKMPHDKLVRMQKELKLTAGSCVDFRKLPDERRQAFVRYIDCMVEAMARGDDVATRMELAKEFNAAPVLDHPELERAASKLTVDVAVATGATSPSYSPTSPDYPPPSREGFLNVKKRGLTAPANWREAWTDEDMNKLFTEIAYFTETTYEMILDIHHGNVELSSVAPRMGLGTYAKYLQPKHGMDNTMSNLLERCDRHQGATEPGRYERLLKRPRSA